MTHAPEGALPLSGRKILVTRSPDQAGEFAALLRQRGAEVVCISLIRFDPPDSWDAADRAIDRLGSFSLVLFTSANAVERFLARLEARGRDPGILSRSRLAAIGPKTSQALLQHRLRPSLVPQEFVAEGLLSLLEGESVAGMEILLPRAQEAREVLPDELEKRGARVTVAPVYRTVRADGNRDLLMASLRSGVDMVTFTASSAVRHFLELLGPERERARGLRVACIGRVTAETALAGGLSPDVVAERSTVEDLAAAILRYFTSPAASGELHST
jgi:uroporphyrinogen III methyltransferase / synthase